ncbi:hypothetical protein HMPREF9969_1094 [Prevotella sp. oral taxon 306 str. F0472]|nr:hypothetical protein HMPREF9969_1094 [Prevotella sp. oral taxon 306 str. F0472]
MCQIRHILFVGSKQPVSRSLIIMSKLRFDGRKAVLSQ